MTVLSKCRQRSNARARGIPWKGLRDSDFVPVPGTGSHYPLAVSVPTPVPYLVPVGLRTAPALTRRESAAALPGPAEAEAGTEALEAQSAPIC